MIAELRRRTARPRTSSPRAATQTVSGEIGALEQVGGFSGKGATLAEGLLYAGDPAQYKTELAQIAALTPAEVRAALQRWLTRPAYTLAVVPGERTEDGAPMGGWGDEGDRARRPRPTRASPPPPLAHRARSAQLRRSPRSAS